MEYQDIVISYKNGNLDISNLKEKLEKSRKLHGREKYRATVISDDYTNFYTRILDILRTQETSKNINKFKEQLNNELDNYYKRIINSIKKCKAWELMEVNPKEHVIEEFKEENILSKIEKTIAINRNYSAFLEYQKVADIRECLRTTDKFSENTIKKLCFLIMMFNNLKNDNVKREFYCFDKKFLKVLIDFKKSKILRLEEFIQTKSKVIQNDYKKYSHFFTTEDYRDISDNLILTAKTLKQPVSEIIEAFCELSESEAEKVYLEEEYEDLKEIKEKCIKMISLNPEKNKVHVENKNQRVIAIKPLKTKILEDENSKKIQIEDKVKEIENERIIKIQNKTTVKEQVNPIIFSWLEREDITLTRRVTSKKLNAFFERIKIIERETGVRASLFLITNASKEITVKRVIEFQKKARNQGLPRLFEGALGGYGAFRVDAQGNVIDIATMSEVNRIKIIKLLENNLLKTSLPSDIILQEECNYLRYQISDKKDKSITQKSIKLLADRISNEPNIKTQPLKILPYMEDKCVGIDVLLKSQLEGILKIPAYYKAKYQVAPGKTKNVKISEIDCFIGQILDQNEKTEI